jgi:hypothetical protein
MDLLSVPRIEQNLINDVLDDPSDFIECPAFQRLQSLTAPMPNRSKEFLMKALGFPEGWETAEEVTGHGTPFHIMYPFFKVLLNLFGSVPPLAYRCMLKGILTSLHKTVKDGTLPLEPSFNEDQSVNWDTWLGMKVWDHYHKHTCDTVRAQRDSAISGNRIGRWLVSRNPQCGVLVELAHKNHSFYFCDVLKAVREAPDGGLVNAAEKFEWLKSGQYAGGKHVEWVPSAKNEYHFQRHIAHERRSGV